MGVTEKPPRFTGAIVEPIQWHTTEARYHNDHDDSDVNMEVDVALLEIMGDNPEWDRLVPIVIRSTYDFRAVTTGAALDEAIARMSNPYIVAYRIAVDVQPKPDAESNVQPVRVVSHRRDLAVWLATGAGMEGVNRLVAPSWETYVSIKRAIMLEGLRLRVGAKTGWHCWYCGVTLKRHSGHHRSCEIEHKTPWSRGGTDDIGNLVPACRTCNHDKRTMTADEYRMKVASRNLAGFALDNAERSALAATYQFWGERPENQPGSSSVR